MRNGHTELVEYLLINDADVSTKTASGRSVYHNAAYNGNQNILKILVSHNSIHVNDVDNENVTALLLAVQQNHADVVIYLL